MTNIYLDHVGPMSADLEITPANLLGRTFYSGGKKYIYAMANTTLTALTPYRVCYTAGTAATMPAVGPLTDGVFMNLIAIPSRTLYVGECDAFQIGGLATTVVMPSFDWTPTYAIQVHDGALTQISSVPTGLNTEIGFTNARLTTGAVTAADIYLYGSAALGTT